LVGVVDGAGRVVGVVAGAGLDGERPLASEPVANVVDVLLLLGSAAVVLAGVGAVAPELASMLADLRPVVVDVVVEALEQVGVVGLVERGQGEGE